MKSSRLNLIIAFVLAVAAGFSVWMYTAGAKTAVQNNEDIATVLIAKQVIPVGTTLADAYSQGLIGKDNFPKGSLPQGVLTPDDANDAAVAKTKVSQVSVPKGSILGSNYFVTVSDQKPNVGPLQVPAGMFAVSVNTPEQDHIGTFIVPGVEVAVFCTYTELTGTGTNSANAQSASALRTRLLVDKSTVIAVGAATSVGAANAAAATNKNAGSLITLSADQENAQKIIHCTRDGQVYLSLLGHDTNPTPDGGTSSENLFKN